MNVKHFLLILVIATAAQAERFWMTYNTTCTVHTPPRSTDGCVNVQTKFEFNIGKASNFKETPTKTDMSTFYFNTGVISTAAPDGIGGTMQVFSCIDESDNHCVFTLSNDRNKFVKISYDGVMFLYK